MRRLTRRRVLAIVVILLGPAVALFAWGLYDRPAHHYNMAYEPCWYAAALAAIGAPSTFAPRMCSSSSGNLPGVGYLLRTRPFTGSPGHDLVIFTTAQNTDRGVEGLAYVIGEPPPYDSCVLHLGGPWWQLAFENIPSMSCPRGFTFQPGPYWRNLRWCGSCILVTATHLCSRNTQACILRHCSFLSEARRNGSATLHWRLGTN